jgi:hypothetical protein
MNSKPLGYYKVPQPWRKMRHRVEVQEKERKLEVPLVVREKS